MQPEMIKGATKAYNYLLERYGIGSIPIKLCTFVKLCSGEVIPCAFRSSGANHTARYFTKEALHQWFEKSTGKKLAKPVN